MATDKMKHTVRHFTALFSVLLHAVLLFVLCGFIFQPDCFAAGQYDYTEYVTVKSGNSSQETGLETASVENSMTEANSTAGANSTAAGTSTVEDIAPVEGNPSTETAATISSDSDAKFAGDVVTISSQEDFLNFVVACLDPGWSVGRTVYLECDIDLADESFDPLGTFSGIFYGNRHTVSGLNISGEYSRAGFFSALTESAYVSELRVTGSVDCIGKTIAGGLAGENSGKIQNCIFEGDVKSEYLSAGLVGINFEEGIVTDSKTSGAVSSPVCAGGIAGDNRGRLISCENYSEVSSSGADSEASGSGGKSGVLSTGGAVTGGISATGSGTEENCKDHSSSGKVLLKLSRGKLIFGILIALGLAFLSGAVALIIVTLRDED